MSIFKYKNPYFKTRKERREHHKEQIREYKQWKKDNNVVIWSKEDIALVVCYGFAFLLEIGAIILFALRHIGRI
jgi:hypothetical protein